MESNNNQEESAPESGRLHRARKKRSKAVPNDKAPGAAEASKAEEAAPAKKAMRLAALAEGMPGLTAAAGQTLAEAAAVCLEDRKHPSGVRLQRGGMMPDDMHVEWLPVDEQQRRCYADMPS